MQARCGSASAARCAGAEPRFTTVVWWALYVRESPGPYFKDDSYAIEHTCHGDPAERDPMRRALRGGFSRLMVLKASRHTQLPTAFPSATGRRSGCPFSAEVYGAGHRETRQHVVEEAIGYHKGRSEFAEPVPDGGVKTYLDEVSPLEDHATASAPTSGHSTPAPPGCRSSRLRTPPWSSYGCARNSVVVS